MKTVLTTVLLVGGLALGAILLGSHFLHLTRRAAAQPDNATPSARRPVLVELFTSEGCSSCPPADLVLARLQQEQPVESAEIITLSEHVDYWNHLGWKDPYSDARFTARQDEYANAFHIDGMYTPQMVVDGSSEFVGSDSAKARSEIARAALTPKANVTIRLPREVQNTKTGPLPLQITVGQTEGFKHSAEVVVAITESGLKSSVARGENEGKTLTHSSVVRQWISAGRIAPHSQKQFEASVTARLKSTWNPDQLNIVAFVQDTETRRILGLSAVRLEGHE